MPSPCPPFAFNHCYGPFPIEIRIGLPAGYVDRLIPDNEDSLFRRSELDLVLNTTYDQHPGHMKIRRHGGESAVECGATRVYQPATRDGTPPPVERWLVETFLHCPAFPVGWRDRGQDLTRMWVETVRRIPLPGGAGDITVTVVDPTDPDGAGVSLSEPRTEPR